MFNLDTIKEAASWANKVGNHELYTALIEARVEALNMIEENRLLKEQISELKNEIDISKKLVLKNKFYYFEGEGDIPHCPRCWDVQRKLITVHEETNRGWAEPYLRCPNCDFSPNRGKNIGRMKNF